MKKNILKITLLSAIALTTFQTYAVINSTNTVTQLSKETTTKTFKIYGNCGMCEKTIEGSLKNVKGVEKADWDKETKMMEATFNEKEISLDQIKMKIAAVGYDTEEHRATKKAYSNLPGCCQYDRPEMKMKKGEDHTGHKH
jgi:periplasmic mercuric ion binding protein